MLLFLLIQDFSVRDLNTEFVDQLPPLVPEMDWSFMEGYENDLKQFVEDLCTFKIVVFWNDDVDVRIIEMRSEQEIFDFVNSFFQEPHRVTQLILPNPSFRHDPDNDLTKDYLCTHFRLIAENYNSSSPINYKLRNFFFKSGLEGVFSKCGKAVIIGMTGSYGSGYISVPSQFLSISIPEVETIDVNSMREAETEELCGIPGIVLPTKMLPMDIQNRILSYCQSPCAGVIRNECDRVNRIFMEEYSEIFYIFHSIFADYLLAH
jgi:hypothetical protein